MIVPPLVVLPGSWKARRRGGDKFCRVVCNVWVGCRLSVFVTRAVLAVVAAVAFAATIAVLLLLDGTRE